MFSILSVLIRSIYLLNLLIKNGYVFAYRPLLILNPLILYHLGQTQMISSIGLKVKTRKGEGEGPPIYEGIYICHTCSLVLKARPFGLIKSSVLDSMILRERHKISIRRLYWLCHLGNPQQLFYGKVKTSDKDKTT